MDTVIALPSSQSRTLAEVTPKFPHTWLMRRDEPAEVAKTIILRSDRPEPLIPPPGGMVCLEGYRGDSYHAWRVLAAFEWTVKLDGSHPGSMDEMHQFYAVEDR